MTIKRAGTIALAAALAAATAQGASATATATMAPACSVADLSLHVVRDEALDGMSHSGAIVIVRNASAQSCTVPALATLTANDAKGRVVATGIPAGARFMHPGPVVFPLLLAPKQSASTTIRWISGDVFEPGISAKAATLTLAIGGGHESAPLDATMWGNDAGVSFTQEHLRLTSAP